MYQAALISTVSRHCFKSKILHRTSKLSTTQRLNAAVQSKLRCFSDNKDAQLTEELWTVRKLYTC